MWYDIEYYRYILASETLLLKHKLSLCKVLCKFLFTRLLRLKWLNSFAPRPRPPPNFVTDRKRFYADVPELSGASIAFNLLVHRLYYHHFYHPPCTPSLFSLTCATNASLLIPYQSDLLQRLSLSLGFLLCTGFVLVYSLSVQCNAWH